MHIIHANSPFFGHPLCIQLTICLFVVLWPLTRWRTTLPSQSWRNSGEVIWVFCALCQVSHCFVLCVRLVFCGLCQVIGVFCALCQVIGVFCALCQVSHLLPPSSGISEEMDIRYYQNTEVHRKTFSLI